MLCEMNRAAVRGVLALFLVIGSCVAQVSTGYRFEVASVKRVTADTPIRFSGGPGSADPGRASYSRATVLDLLIDALGVARRDISGPPWLESEYFSVTATMPPSTTVPEFRQMIANLLIERFHLAFHRERKDSDGYELLVAKGGPKIKPSSTFDPAGETGSRAGTPRQPGTQDSDGFPILAAGGLWQSLVEDGEVKATFDCSMDTLASALGSLLTKQVHSSSAVAVSNRTGLVGRYRFRLRYVAAVDSSPGDLLQAIQAQLGLLLVESKLSADHIVVDHLDRLPTEN